jgi:hypothetical protein
MQTGSSGTLIGWKSGQTTFVPLWDRMEGAWLWTLGVVHLKRVYIVQFKVLYTGQYSSNISCACGSTGSSIWFGFRRLRYDGYFHRGDT